MTSKKKLEGVKSFGGRDHVSLYVASSSSSSPSSKPSASPFYATNSERKGTNEIHHYSPPLPPLASHRIPPHPTPHRHQHHSHHHQHHHPIATHLIQSCPFPSSSALPPRSPDYHYVTSHYTMTTAPHCTALHRTALNRTALPYPLRPL